MTRQLKQVLLLRTALLKTLSPEKEQLYNHILHLWLRKRCSLEEFSLSVSKLLSKTGIKLHDKFLRSLSKISCGLVALPFLGSSTRIRRFENINSIMFYKFIDKTLPCTAICSARFYVFAWESGIISVHPHTGKLLHLALTRFLKDLIFALIAFKKSFKVKSNQFKCLENKERIENVNLNLPSGCMKKNSITTYDLITVLQSHPTIIKMGCSKYIEKIINGPLVNNVAMLMPLII